MLSDTSGTRNTLGLFSVSLKKRKKNLVTQTRTKLWALKALDQGTDLLLQVDFFFFHSKMLTYQKQSWWEDGNFASFNFLDFLKN